MQLEEAQASLRSNPDQPFVLEGVRKSSLANPSLCSTAVTVRLNADISTRFGFIVREASRSFYLNTHERFCTGAMEDWPARDWDFNELRQRYGEAWLGWSAPA